MPSTNVLELYSSWLGFSGSEAARLGDKAEEVVNALSSANGSRESRLVGVPKNPILHAFVSDFLLRSGIAKRVDGGFDYGDLIRHVAMFMDGGYLPQHALNRDKWLMDANTIGQYSPGVGVQLKPTPP